MNKPIETTHLSELDESTAATSNDDSCTFDALVMRCPICGTDGKPHVLASSMTHPDCEACGYHWHNNEPKITHQAENKYGVCHFEGCDMSERIEMVNAQGIDAYTLPTGCCPNASYPDCTVCGKSFDLDTVNSLDDETPVYSVDGTVPVSSLSGMPWDSTATPTFPRTDTLAARALMRLATGQQFTHKDFQNETASYRLSGYIEHLRNSHNWPIETRDEIAPTNDKVGRNTTYGRYFIEPDVLKGLRLMMGERLTLFIDAVQRYEQGGNNE